MDFLEYYNNYTPKEDFFPLNIQPRSDKGSWHDYIEGYYNDLFTDKKQSPISLMEIGLQAGQSILLWKNWFENLRFVGIDIDIFVKRYEDENTYIIVGDAYNLETIKKINNEKFDFIIDDGPHTLETQLFFVENYYQFLKEDGKLIVEDIQSESDLFELVKKCNELNYIYKIIDLRSNKERYDDIILEITKQ